MRTLRISQQIDASTMAKKLHVTRSALSRVEVYGSGFTVARLRLAARALGLSVWELMRCIDYAVEGYVDLGYTVS